MRIAVHDFGGYAFPADLSRQLALDGHDVRHFVCADVFSGKAEVNRLEMDPPNLSFESVASSSSKVRKYDPIHRFRWEWNYGKLLAARVNAFAPDVLLSANTPLIAQWRLFAHVRKQIARVIWLQDIVSVAIERHLASRSPLARTMIAPILQRTELRLAAEADHVVAIAPHFVEFLADRGIPRSRITEIRNWAPVSDIPTGNRMNEWRASHGFGDDFLVVYSGTLGLKHNPLVLADIARGLPPGCRVVVLAEGPGVDRLRREASDVANLELLSFVDYDELPMVLAAADVLVALLEPDASAFSVPSKILTYLCAGRPIVASVPEDNLASHILRAESGGGMVVAPGDVVGLSSAIEAIRTDPARARRLGDAGRAYAEAQFDAATIARRFGAVLAQTLADGEDVRGPREPHPQPEEQSAGIGSSSEDPERSSGDGVRAQHREVPPDVVRC